MRVNPLSYEYNSIYSKDGHYRKHYSMSPYLKVWNKVATYIGTSDTVLDLGCGTGQLMDLLLDKGIKKYIGYDFSLIAWELANGLIRNRNAEVAWVDLYKVSELPIVDVYVAVEVMEHLKDDLAVLKLVPSGKRLIVTVPNYLGGSHIRKFDNEEEVLNRYGNLLKDIEITTLSHGSGKIFVLTGIMK